jgi:hypothetical protein
MDRRELHALKQNGSASVEELREFLAKLKGRSPQEVIGIVSSSLLIQSLTLATVGTLALIAVMTVVPYMLWGPLKSGPQVAKTPAAAPAESSSSETAKSPSSEKTNASGAETAKATSEAEPDPAKAAKVLGIEETKTADPTKNPLESNLDKLLDQ